MKRALVLGVLLSGAVWAQGALDLLNAGEYAQAFEQARKSGDALTAAESALAQVLYRAPEDRVWIEKAIQAGRDAVQAQSGSARAHFLLAGAVAQRARVSGLSPAAFSASREARSELEKSLVLDGKFTLARVALANWHAGAYAKAGFLSGGNPGVARQLVQQALGEEPLNIYVNYRAALTFMELKDPGTARSLLQKVVGLTPDTAQQRDVQALARELLKKLGTGK